MILIPNQNAPQDERALAVLEAAAAVFLAHGFSAVTTDIRRIQGHDVRLLSQQESDVHCSNRARMRGDDRIVPTMQIVAGGIATALADLGMSYLRLVLSPSAMALFRVVVAEAPRFPDVGRRFYLTGPKVVNEKIAACLTEAAQAGEVNIQSIGAGAAASLFISMVRGEAQLECLPHPAAKPSAAQMDIWVQNAVTTFLGAYGAAKLPSG